MNVTPETVANKSAGSIHFVVGNVEAIDSEGNRRTLQIGDVVYPQEAVVTGVDGAIHIDLPDGQIIELSSNSEFSFPLFGQTALTAEPEVEIEAEQLEIEPPNDQTLSTDNTEQTNSGFGDQTILNLSAIQVEPEAGFDTSGRQAGTEDSTDFVAADVLAIDENDAPVAIDDLSVLGEGESLSVGRVNGLIDPNDFDSDGDILIVTGIRFGSESGAIGQPLIGSFGTLIVNADGSYSYTANQSATDVLNAGDVVNDTFTYTISDGRGGEATAKLEFEISGSNDNAFIGVDNQVNQDYLVQEAGGKNNKSFKKRNTASGKLKVTDADDGESSFATPTDTQLQGDYGVFTFDPNTGVWDYKLDQGLADKLNKNDKAQDTLEVKSADGTASTTITVDITGSNDKAVIKADSEFTQDYRVREAGGNDNNKFKNQNTAGGKLKVTDADEGEAYFQTPTDAALEGEYGSFTFDPTNGEWTYTLKDQMKADSLEGGEKFRETLKVTSADGTASKVIKVVITGTNDNPTLEAVPELSATEDDLESGFSVTKENSTLLNGAADVDDDHEALSIHKIKGSSGGAVNAGKTVTVELVREDTGEILNVRLTINADGSYSVLPADLDVLPEGVAATGEFSYSVKDDGNGKSALKTTTLTVTGSDDKSEIKLSAAGSDKGEVTEGQDTDPNTPEIDLKQSGKLTVTDVDGNTGFAINKTVFDSGKSTNQLAVGQLQIDADGEWHYEVDNDLIKYLGEGDTITEVYTVETTDGTKHDITITINGADIYGPGHQVDALDDPGQAKTVRYGSNDDIAAGVTHVSWDKTSVEAYSGKPGVSATAVDQSGATVNNQNTTANKVGVASGGSPDDSIEIQYKDNGTPETSDDTYESLSIGFKNLASSATVAVSGVAAGDSIKWVCYLNGQLVTEGSFDITADGSTEFAIDTNELFFDEIEFIPANENNSGFFVDWVETIEPDSAFQTYDFKTLRIPKEALLDNDSDSDNHGLSIVGIGGVNSPVDFDSASLIWNEADGEVVFYPGNDFDYLAPGETTEVTFEYTITDDDASDTATVTVTVVGQYLAAPANPPTVDRLETTDHTPILTGTAELPDQYILTVTVNGVTYSYDPEGDGSEPLQYDSDNKTWSLEIPDEDQLSDDVYDVTANVSVPGARLSDETDAELVVYSEPEAGAPAAPIIYATPRGTSLFTDFEATRFPVWGTVRAEEQGYQTENEAGRIEIGRESNYLNSSNPGDNQILELKAYDGDYNIFADIDSVKGEVFQFTFDHAGRKNNITNNDSAVEVWVYDLDENGKIINSTMLAFIDPSDAAALRTQTFYFAASGANTRFELLAAERGDSTGAIIDDIRVETVGYQSTSSIPLNVVAFTVNDNETLAVTVSNIPVGVTITDGTSGNAFTATEGNTEIDISGWDLSSMVLEPDADFIGNVSLEFTATATASGTSSSESVVNLNYTVYPDVLEEHRETGSNDPNVFETIDGSAENDAINGLAGNDIINGLDGNDILSGDQGDDTINGGAGKDFIDGGTGNDTLSGGEGGDLFIFKIADLLTGSTVQTDTITDFTLGNALSTGSNADILDISGLIDFGSSGSIDPASLQEKGITASFDELTSTATLSFTTMPGDDDPELKIVLSNSSNPNGWNDFKDGTVSGDDVLQQLINNGQLIV
ncbi:VCBS domain-containing protein [Endozoicomonas ascidiicola]|uniref:VCBS domain-containing protein n=1 Tax=Endozoicomonas ascidiicola TaxID=1698521 RepID=UPI0008348C51|nr:VCBS domain-containing protein [Endozoicomonas ascidiicola]